MNNGSTIDILAFSAFEKMGIDREKLELVNQTCVAFIDEVVQLVGKIVLPIMMGQMDTTKNKIIQYFF